MTDRLIDYAITFGKIERVDTGNSSIEVPVTMGVYYLQSDDRITAINRFDMNFHNFVILAIVNMTLQRVEFDHFAEGA
jgi:hypothetical protein